MSPQLRLLPGMLYMFPRPESERRGQTLIMHVDETSIFRI